MLGLAPMISQLELWKSLGIIKEEIWGYKNIDLIDLLEKKLGKTGFTM